MSGQSGPKKIERDQFLFKEGDAPDAMYVVKSGKLAVVKAKQSSEIILAEIGPGAMVGEMAFFDNKPRSASVKALKDSEVIALPYKALHAQFANFPEWCKAIMRTVNDHLRNANQRIKTLERNETGEELFPPHTINKLLSILGFVANRYGKVSEEEKGVIVDGYTLRTYTIQIFQEATHKMQKILDFLDGLKFLKVEDAGEGRQRIIIYKLDFIFQFVEWHNNWLFKKEDERVVVKESEIKILKGLIHFAKKAPKNERGFTKLNLIDVQNDSMKELGFLIKPEETLGLAEKKIIAEHIMEEGGGLSTIFMIEDLEKVTPFWEIIYGVAKLKR